MGKWKKQKKENNNKTRQAFLLSFFEDTDEYKEKEVNGFWLVKQYNGNTDDWQVAIYTKESFEKYNDFIKYPMLFGRQKEHIKSIWKK